MGCFVSTALNVIKYPQRMAEEDKQKLTGEYRAIDSRYRRDVALLEARPKLEAAVLALWGVVDVVCVSAFVLGVVFYIVNGNFVDARQSASILNNVETARANVLRTAPVGLAVQDARAVSVTSGRYDLFVEAENPNPEWYVAFDYYFVYDGGQTGVEHGFLNPGDERFVAAINVPLERRPSGLQMVMSNYVWQRVDRHTIANTERFMAEHENITVESATYTKDLTVGSEQVATSKIVLENRTPFSYWNPAFVVKLMRGSTVVSLTKVTVPKFLANETRTVDVRWFGEVPPSGTLSVEPEIFYFDPTIYMSPGDEMGADVRR